MSGRVVAHVRAKRSLVSTIDGVCSVAASVPELRSVLSPLRKAAEDLAYLAPELRGAHEAQLWCQVQGALYGAMRVLVEKGFATTELEDRVQKVWNDA